MNYKINQGYFVDITKIEIWKTHKSKYANTKMKNT